MKEIGGYIELDRYNLPMLHEGAEALNSGRSCLAYLIRTRKIKKIALPYFLCDSVIDLCTSLGVDIRYYHVGNDLLPADVELEDDEWLYLVNYYGQLSCEQVTRYRNRFGRVIADYAQAYFQMPADGVDTIYTCRKFFGVADGAFLYTDVLSEEEFETDESFERMHFLLGRYERSASEFYGEYAQNNKRFATEPIKRMSKLTDNLLHAIDYESVKKARTDNFSCLHEMLAEKNGLRLKVPDGAFMYPLYFEGAGTVRAGLAAKKIYIPTLWPNVEKFGDIPEKKLARDILPLPCDQRYNKDDMISIAKEIEKCLS